MGATIHGIKTCDTMRKAMSWLAQHGVDFTFHDYRVSGIHRAALERWERAVGWERLLNKSSTTFRALPEADKAGIDRDRAIDLMLNEPTMIKRPVLETDETVEVGFRQARYEALFAS